MTPHNRRLSASMLGAAHYSLKEQEQVASRGKPLIVRTVTELRKKKEELVVSKCQCETSFMHINERSNLSIHCAVPLSV